MALLGLLMRGILVKHMSCSDSFTGAGRMIYSLYQQGQERQGFPLFSVTLFFVLFPDVRDHCLCSSTTERFPPGTAIPVDTSPAHLGKELAQGEPLGAPVSGEVTANKTPLQFSLGLQGQGCLRVCVPGCPCLTLQDQEAPRLHVPEQEDAVEAGSPSGAANGFCAKESH